MTPLKASLSDEQLAHVIILLERVLNSMAIMYPEMFADGDVCDNQGKDVTAVQAATAAAAAASETDYAVKMRGLSTTSTISHEQSCKFTGFLFTFCLLFIKINNKFVMT